MTRSLAPALLLALAVSAWSLRPLWDIDLWWHIAAGRLILDEGVPRRDVFSSAAPEAPWVTFQWGYEALVAALERGAGLRAVQALHAGAIGLAAGLAGALGARRAGAWLPALAAVAVGLLLFEDRVRARPHVFELLFVVALLPLCLEAARGTLAELAAVALAGLWANLHAVSAAWWLALVGALALGRPSPRRLGLLAAGLALMLASPPAREGALGAMTSHQGWPSELVPELRPTLAYADEGAWGALMLLGVAAGLAAALDRLRRPVGWPERLVALGCALAACLMARWVWFAAVPLGLALLDRPRRLAGLVILGCALALGARLAPRWQATPDWTAVVQPGAFPVAALDWMQAQGLAPPLDTREAWTGYALYRLHPPLTTLADGRLLFGPEIGALLLRRGAGDASTFDEAARRFGTRAVLWPTAEAPPLDPARWRRVYADEQASLWLLAGPP